MSTLTVLFFNQITAARDALQFGFGFVMPIQHDRLRDDIIKAVTTLRDMRKYVLENLGVEHPSDDRTSIKYDEVTLRRLTHVKDTFEKTAHATGNFERVSGLKEYKDAIYAISQFRKHIKEQIKQAGK